MERGITVHLQSFGRKYGCPEADIVLDVRCLENPYWQPELREKSGLDKDVKDFIFHNESSFAYAEALARLLCLQARLAQQRGCAHLRIAVGCTGGRHRSVAVTEFLAQALKQAGFPVLVSHRDVLRDNAPEEAKQ